MENRQTLEIQLDTKIKITTENEGVLQKCNVVVIWKHNYPENIKKSIKVSNNRELATSMSKPEPYYRTSNSENHNDYWRAWERATDRQWRFLSWLNEQMAGSTLTASSIAIKVSQVVRLEQVSSKEDLRFEVQWSVKMLKYDFKKLLKDWTTN